ncbi:MAG: glucose 1-dehydrogenase [Phycisphaerales bacterium]
MPEHPTRRLNDKRALVTGAARGIGLAISAAFVREGARVLLTDIREDQLRDEAARLKQPHTRLDVRHEPDWVAAMQRAIDELGGVDIVVNNAGITGFDQSHPRPHDPEHATLDDWRAVHATNLDGVFLGCKHAIRTMRAQRVDAASIINIGSRSGLVGVPGAAAYASSKAAVRNHTRTVALHCAQHGLPVRCNVIQPAAVLTPMWEPLLGEGPERDENMRRFAADCPLKRFGTPEEVAHLAVYLASDESAYTTGAEFDLDGGLRAGDASPDTADA